MADKGETIGTPVEQRPGVPTYYQQMIVVCAQLVKVLSTSANSLCSTSGVTFW